MFQVRRFYYWLLASCSETSQVRNFTGFGLYDRKVISAIRSKDSATLAALDPRHLQAGSSEIRNWLVVGEMARDLDMEWIEYVPGYRSPALTGTGLAFAAWKTIF